MWESQAAWTLATPLGSYTFSPQRIASGEAWAHFTEVDGSDMAVVRNIDKVSGDDGARIGDGYGEQRVLSMTGKCRALTQGALQREAQEIRGLVNSLLRADGTLTWWPSGFPPLQIDRVRRFDKPDVDRGRGLAKDMLLSLVAGDPRVYTQAWKSVDVSAAPNVGFTSPMKSPIVQRGTGADATITNLGDTDTPPIIDVYGPGFGPTILNITTGEQISLLAGLTIADGDFLRIDVAADTVLLNGQDLQDRYRYIDAPNTMMWKLAPGANVLRFTMSGIGLNSKATVKARDAWMP